MLVDLLAPSADGAWWRVANEAVVGYVSAESGVGEYARLLIETLQVAGERCAVVPYRRTVLRQLAPFPGSPVAPEHDVTILAVNADQLSTALQDMGPDMLVNRYTIGMWAWEVEAMPVGLVQSSEALDEIA